MEIDMFQGQLEEVCNTKRQAMNAEADLEKKLEGLQEAKRRRQAQHYEYEKSKEDMRKAGKTAQD